MVLWEKKVTVRMRTEGSQEPSDTHLQLGEIQGRRMGCKKQPETASSRFFHEQDAPVIASSAHKMQHRVTPTTIKSILWGSISLPTPELLSHTNLVGIQYLGGRGAIREPPGQGSSQCSTLGAGGPARHLPVPSRDAPCPEMAWAESPQGQSLRQMFGCKAFVVLYFESASSEIKQP